MATREKVKSPQLRGSLRLNVVATALETKHFARTSENLRGQ